MFVVSLRCSNWYEGSDVLKAVALKNAFYFNCNHPDVFLRFLYIWVRASWIECNYSLQLINTRSCNYSCTSSWRWVFTPETCRAACRNIINWISRIVFFTYLFKIYSSQNNCILSIIHVATCFNSKSSSGYLLNDTCGT